jgi:hypothetical protein
MATQFDFEKSQMKTEQSQKMKDLMLALDEKVTECIDCIVRRPLRPLSFIVWANCLLYANDAWSLTG